MIKELKFLMFLFFIFLFFFLSLKYYFSDENIKNFYRSHKNINEKIMKYSKELILLENDTNNIVKYIEKNINKNKKDYNFWKLINNNEK
jgi:hypothetical protein